MWSLFVAVASAARLAVTVDDLPLNGPDEDIAGVEAINRAVVSALAGVPAVGFVNEGKLEREGERDRRIAVLRGWVDAGLELGNHTRTHPDLNKVGPEAYIADLLLGEPVTRMLLGDRPLRWFRHCFLRTGKTAADKATFEAWLSGHGYRVAPVTLENDDWAFNRAYVAAVRAKDPATATKVAEAYLAHYRAILDFYEPMGRELFGRDIDQVLLLHDNRLNADHLPAVLELFRSRGYTFAPLEQVLADPAYAHADTYVGGWGKSWIQRWWVSEGRPSRFAEEPSPPDWIGAD